MTRLQLKSLRERLGLTQKQLAEKLGVHWNSVARMEQGNRPITEATAKHTELLEQYEKLKKSGH